MLPSACMLHSDWPEGDTEKTDPKTRRQRAVDTPGGARDQRGILYCAGQGYRTERAHKPTGVSSQHRTTMMSPDDRVLQDLLYGSDLGDEAKGAELNVSPGRSEERAAADNAPTAVSIQEPMTCSGCGEQVCDRFFLLAAGGVWHGTCLRCSQCQCELQTHPSLFWRDGNIYCQQDYCRMFGGGQCARCFQPIPASALVMRSGDLTFHPHCFSCQDCDVKLIPGNLYCVQGQNIYCQSHYHDNGGFTQTNDLLTEQTMKEAQHGASGEGEESVSSPEPRLDDRGAGRRTRRRTKRIRTCFRSEQLRALEMYFAQKQNPDGKDWTCLAHKTGLPKRVLQVWFQNARAKLRRSLTSEDSQVNSPSTPPRGVSMPRSPPPSTLDQSCSFATSTIDHLQLSLLTSPLGNSPLSPALTQPDFFLDYDSQSAPGRVSSLEAYEDFGEERRGAEGGVGHDGSAFTPHFC